ncbi:hypothetical protein [Nocardia sp. CDC160]|nr:hypothetical protein [Nocardia sp. CDC160]MEC3917927.1 hypothetical protein [Nocardia sp. CDC160]
MPDINMVPDLTVCTERAADIAASDGGIARVRMLTSLAAAGERALTTRWG